MPTKIVLPEMILLVEPQVTMASKFDITSETDDTLCIWDHLSFCSLGAIAYTNQKTIRGIKIKYQMKHEINLIVLKTVASIGELRNKPFSEEIKTSLASKYVHIKIIKRCIFQ